MSDDLKNIIEAVLLVSDGPVNVVRIQSLFEEETRPEAAQIHEAIEILQADCENRGIELCKIGSGFRYQTRQKYADYLRKLQAAKPPRLSRALLETLSIIAYRQPVSRGDIEEVRGVAVSVEIMQRLIEREWVKQVGVRDVPGRPALFGTTPEFLSYFNLSSLKDLPDLMDQRALGEIAGEMETPLPPEILASLENDAEDEAESIEGIEEDTGQPDQVDEYVEEDSERQPDQQLPGNGEAETEDDDSADLNSDSGDEQQEKLLEQGAQESFPADAVKTG